MHSLSGNERNHYFANRGGRTFDDLSAISGLDNVADSRGFALLDYDHDGWQDVALVNANEPLFNLYRNTMGEIAGMDQNKAIAIRFIGGRRKGQTPAAPFACKDGYGALVIAKFDGWAIKREHRCGEGFSVQNSARMILGIGDRESVPSLTVRWPSGREAAISDVSAGVLLTASEDGLSITEEPYQSLARSRSVVKTKEDLRHVPFPLIAADDNAELRIYISTATWCAACVEHLPEVEQLVRQTRDDGVVVLGLPIDESDDREELAAFQRKWRPAYEMLSLTAVQQREVAAFLVHATGQEHPPLPTTIITDRQGRALEVMGGIPSLSIIRPLLERQRHSLLERQRHSLLERQRH